MNQSFKAIIILVLGLFIGYWAGTKSVSVPSASIQVSAPETEPSTVFTIGKEDSVKLEALNSESANQQLAELLKLFLADVAFRMSQSNKNLLNQVVAEKGTAPVLADASSCELPTDPKEIAALKKQLDDQQMHGTLRKLKVTEQKLNDLRNLNDEDRFLKEAEVENVFPLLKNGVNLDHNKVVLLTGAFVGQLIFSGGEKRKIEYIVKSVAKTKDGKPTADYTLKMYDAKGEVISNSNSSGLFSHHHHGIADDMSGMLIESGGGSTILQMYSVNGGSKLIGNIYRKKNADNFQHAGHFRMQRK